jgi:cardiolipin synthase
MKKLSAKKKRWIERTVVNDRSYKRFLYNRFYAYILAVLLQLVGYAVLLFLFAYKSDYAPIVQFVVIALEIVFVFIIISDNERPSTKLSWAIVILIFPLFGVPMYLVNGRGRPTKKMAKRLNKSIQDNALSENAFYGERRALGKGTVSAYLDQAANYPPLKGDISYYKTGEEAFPELVKGLESAKRYIFLEYFIIAHGKMWQAILKTLLKKALEGVKIYIIYDDFGCMKTLPPDYERYLESLHENIKCMTFNNVVPIFAVRMNNRDHRKITVIDGKIAFTGGYNLADEYIGEKIRFGHWKDSGVKITGDAVYPFARIFCNTWNAFRKDKIDLQQFLPALTGEGNAECIQPYDDSPLDKLSVGETVYLDIINRAQKYVYIFTPYLILDDFMRTALCLAAARGVDVRIVTPGIPDKKAIYRLTRANYGILLKAGVRIYEYTPGFIHSKSMVSDGECAVVGTINLDYRSLYHHFENAVYFKDQAAIADLKKDCDDTFMVSREYTKENTKRGVFGRLFDAVLRVFETLM